MVSIKRNIVIEQNADFSHTFPYIDATGTPLDATGVTFSGAVRKHHLSANSYLFTFTAANGSITVSMLDSETGYIDAGRHVYDIVAVDLNQNTNRIYEGVATVNPGVTNNVGNNAVFTDLNVIDDGTF